MLSLELLWTTAWADIPLPGNLAPNAYYPTPIPPFKSGARS